MTQEEWVKIQQQRYRDRFIPEDQDPLPKKKIVHYTGPFEGCLFDYDIENQYGKDLNKYDRFD